MSENIINIKDSPTFFLFALPSFFEGVARLMDFSNTLNQYNGSTTPEIADNIAIFHDWLAVGNDLRKSMKDFELLIEKEKA